MLFMQRKESSSITLEKCAYAVLVRASSHQLFMCTQGVPNHSIEEGNDIITLSWLNRKHLYSTINFLKTKQNEIHRSRKMRGEKS